MMLISNILYILLLIAGFFTGLILAKLCKEEIKNWRKRVIIISLISLLVSIGIYLTDFELKYPIIITFLFIIITCLTIVWKIY